jgi:hypothetical protein
MGRSEFGRGIRLVVCAEAVRELIRVTAKKKKCLSVVRLSLALEWPTHKFIFLKALLSRIYAFPLRQPDTFWNIAGSTRAGGAYAF